MDLGLLCLIGAVISFGLAAFKVSAAVDWTNLGFALVTLSFIVPGKI